MIASCYLELGRIYKLQKDWNKSKDHFLKSLNICQEINVPSYLSRTYCENALLYEDMGEIDISKQLFNKGIEIAKENNIEYILERFQKEL